MWSILNGMFDGVTATIYIVIHLIQQTKTKKPSELGFFYLL